MGILCSLAEALACHRAPGSTLLMLPVAEAELRAVTPYAVLLPGLLCLAACAPAPAARSEDSASAASSTAETDAAVVRRAIDSLNTQLERWYAASHADSVASVLADDVWLMGPASPPV